MQANRRFFFLGCFAAALSATSLNAQNTSNRSGNPSGIRPKPSASDYQVSQETSRGTYAASLVPGDQVKHLFAVDVSKLYLVVEVAFFPKGDAQELAADAFSMKTGSKGDLIHPADSVTVAS